MNLSKLKDWLARLNHRVTALATFAIVALFTVVACSGPPPQQASQGIPPEIVVDYIAATAKGARTAYVRHVVNRLTELEGQPVTLDTAVVEGNATEFWDAEAGIPLPAQMFRLASEVTSDSPLAGNFTIGLISSWNINDAQSPKTDFEKEAIAEMEATGEPVKREQVINGQGYMTAMYPDRAVAEACVTCHNEHPIHRERYPDKVFQLNDVMGGVVISLPLGPA
ncbi:DUF3365 domain-containing protein [Synechococcus sp. PCC 7336]|uniref:Tll0287-like domain-containing protein n=1 Tax=Synechococcus sp. PCC 7336 TaxID=195250 RepID=UPI000348A454|nr:DUF3365 domain-containing protein [Synechococcus sp. PCC 7336]